jgi:hypothetical protein
MHISRLVDRSLVVILLFITHHRITTVRVEWQVQEHHNLIFINEICMHICREKIVKMICGQEPVDYTHHQIMDNILYMLLKSSTVIHLSSLSLSQYQS